MVDIIKTSSLDEFGIRQLVEKFDIDSIKPLYDAGAKFSDLETIEIVKLVAKCGIDSIKPLHEAGVEIYYYTAEEIETNNTTDTYDTLEGN